MSSAPGPIPPQTPNTNLASSFSSDTSSLPVWDRLTTWASENKVVVYTIAGVAVVVSGAGVAYYLSESKRSPRDAAAEEKKRLSKKERRKAKQEKGRQADESKSLDPDQSKQESKAPTVEADPLEGLPQIDESTVDTLSEEVSMTLLVLPILTLIDARSERIMLRA